MKGVRFGLAVASAALGIVLGLVGAAGCGTGDCDCGPVEPIVEGTFDVVGAESPSKTPIPFGVPGATIAVGSDVVAIEYSRGEAKVTASYRVLRKDPP